MTLKPASHRRNEIGERAAHAELKAEQSITTDRHEAGYGWDERESQDILRRLHTSGSTYTLKREKFRETMYCLEHGNGKCPVV